MMRWVGEAGYPGEALPVDVVLEAELVGESGALPGAATDIAGELREGIKLKIDPKRFELGLQPIPIAE